MRSQVPGLSTILLLISLILLLVGAYADHTIFTWVSATLALVSLILRGRWLRPRQK